MKAPRVHVSWLRCEARDVDGLRSGLEGLEQRCGAERQDALRHRARRADGWLRASGELDRHPGPRSCACHWGLRVKLVAAAALGRQTPATGNALTGNLLMLARNEVADPQVRALFEHAWEVGPEQAGAELLLAHELLHGHARAAWLCALPFATVQGAVQAMAQWGAADNRIFRVMKGIFRHG